MGICRPYYACFPRYSYLLKATYLFVLISSNSAISICCGFVIMVARSSVARAWTVETIIFCGYFFFLFFFSYRTFSDVGKPTSPKLSHMTWLSPQQNLYYTDFFKVSPKTNGAEKPEFVPSFVSSGRQLAPYSIMRRQTEILTLA